MQHETPEEERQDEDDGHVQRGPMASRRRSCPSPVVSE
jgi:hypothetical protein